MRDGCVSRSPVRNGSRGQVLGRPLLSFNQHYWCSSLHLSTGGTWEKVESHLGGPVVWNPEPPSQPARLLLGIEPDQLFPHGHVTRPLCVSCPTTTRRPRGHSISITSNTWAWAWAWAGA